MPPPQHVGRHTFSAAATPARRRQAPASATGSETLAARRRLQELPHHHRRRSEDLHTTPVAAARTSSPPKSPVQGPPPPPSALQGPPSPAPSLPQGPRQHSVMPTKGGAKKAQGPRTTGLPIHPYEEERLRNCMQNSARLHELGLDDYPVYKWMAATSQHKNSRNQRNREDDESEYDPLQDETVEEDSIDDANSKGSKDKTRKKTNNQTSFLPPGGVKFRSRKRVYADEHPTMATRSKKSIGQPDAVPPPSHPPTNNCVPTPSHPPTDLPLSHPNVSQTTELVANFEDHTQPDDNGGDIIPLSDGHNHMANKDGLPQHGHNTTTMAEGADGNKQMTRKGRTKKWKRGLNMGHGLERVTRARGGKLPVVIAEGHIRPLVPLIAAKYATECNIAVRNHLPVLKHWKDYERQPALIDEFLGILRAKFDIDTNDETVKNGCLEMMKSAIRQRRYKLKKQYFDPFPLHLVPKTSPIQRTSNDQWLDLVESWKAPKKMESCQKNKANRSNVKYPHATGSCSYEVLVENLV
ncbi:unnamed protein product, partial [Urochloa humidicola]